MKENMSAAVFDGKLFFALLALTGTLHAGVVMEQSSVEFRQARGSAEI